MTFLKLMNVSASIDGNPILRDVSFGVDKGQFLTLVGPSGCGKTTTLRVISGFLHPDRGDVIMKDSSILDLPPYKRNIGIVFQDYALFPHMDVFENIIFGLKMHGWQKDRARKRIDELLSLMHLEGYGSRRVSELSGGEKQRVALARALAPEPEILLLDEPLSALDARLRDELRREIKRIQRELELTVIYVTHDQEEALSLSTVLGVMNNGSIEQLGDPVHVYQNPDTLFTARFLGGANLIQGEIVNQRVNGKFTVRTPEGEFTVDKPTGSDLENTVTLYFRREDATLAPCVDSADCDDPGDGGDSFNATLEDLDFFGDEIRARVMGNGGGRFTLKVPTSRKEFDLWEHVGKKVVVKVERFGVIGSG